MLTTTLISLVYTLEDQGEILTQATDLQSNIKVRHRIRSPKAEAKDNKSWMIHRLKTRLAPNALESGLDVL